MQYLNRRFAANAGNTIAAVGRYIWVKSATGQVQIKTDKGETAVLGAGDWIKTDKVFSEFYATDLSGAQNDLTFVISETGEAGKYGTIEIQSATGFSDSLDAGILATATTLILAANSTRNEAIITADSTNPANARIGGATAGAERGVVLVPGATLFLNTTAAVYAYSTGACNFHLAETTY